MESENRKQEMTMQELIALINAQEDDFIIRIKLREEAGYHAEEQ